MEQKNKNGIRTLVIIAAIIAGVAAVLFALTRMEKRIRRAYGRVEQWLRVHDDPVTIDLQDEE